MRVEITITVLWALLLGTFAKCRPALKMSVYRVPDMARTAQVGRDCGQSGKHMLALSSSQFDPIETSAVPNVDALDAGSALSKQSA
jgi:hypothetical protein